MNKKIVYLSGRMDGVSVSEGNGWREYASKFFRNYGESGEWDVYNPYEGKVEEMKNGKTHTDFGTNEIYHRDIYHLDKSDIVLVNLDLPDTVEKEHCPFFTIGEMFHAHRDRKPIIAYTNAFKGRPGYDAIVTKTLPNLEDCLDYIVTNY